MFFQSQLCKAWRLAPRIVRILSIVEHPSTALQLFSETRTIRKSGFTLDIQTSNGFAVSSTNASVRINELGINLCVHVVDDPLSVLSWGLMCYDLEQSISWPPRGTVKLIKGHRVIEIISSLLLRWRKLEMLHPKSGPMLREDLRPEEYKTEETMLRAVETRH